MEIHDLAGKDHWDARTSRARPRLPSKLNPSVADLIALLGRFVVPQSRVLEVGCAPGKFLLWCELAKKANACGVEYASNSYEMTKQLFADAGAHADLRQEDFMVTTFEPGSFDVVYSIGVIEHFTDPRPMVRKHVEMLRVGGTAVITVPHFGAGYGWLARYMDKENYDIHNTSIMSEEKLLELASPDTSARTYAYGRLSPWILSWRRIPKAVSLGLCYSLSAAALLQPFEIKALCPWLVLEIKK